MLKRITKKRSSKGKKGIEHFQNPVGCEEKAVIEPRGQRGEKWNKGQRRKKSGEEDRSESAK